MIAPGGKLTVTTPGEHDIVMVRHFAAPRQLVFEAFFKPELVRRWLLGPPGWTMPHCAIDLRPGGSYSYRWRSEETGQEFGMGGTFHVVEPPSRVVSTERFGDGEAGVVHLFETAGRQTRMTLTMTFADRAARDAAVATGMADGVATSYDRLEAIWSEGTPPAAG